MIKNKTKNIIKILKQEAVGIMPTDTLYGLVCSAYFPKAIQRIYEIKKRNKKKQSIILISSVNDLKKFGVKITEKQKQVFKQNWPGKTSIILECNSSKFKYLHQGTKSLAFRLPAKKTLIEILKKTGPLVAPSANPEGLLPSENIKEAKKYFGNKVDFYLSGGILKGKPSNLIRINNRGKIEVLRGTIK